MDLLFKNANTKTFCDRINPSSYEQVSQTKHSNPVYPTVIELFLSRFDHHYSMIESKDKNLYIKQCILGIATGIDEDKSTKYDKFNYLKCMSPSLIQYGLQSVNSIAAVLYLSDIYNVTTHIHIVSTMKKVITTDKLRDPYNIIYTSNGKWSEVADSDDTFTVGTFSDLGECFILDVKTKDIYKKFLNPIGKYKAPELVDIAQGMGLSLDNNGKKKVKKELYDDINLHQLNLH